MLLPKKAEGFYMLHFPLEEFYVRVPTQNYESGILIQIFLLILWERERQYEAFSIAFLQSSFHSNQN